MCACTLAWTQQLLPRLECAYLAVVAQLSSIQFSKLKVEEFSQTSQTSPSLNENWTYSWHSFVLCTARLAITQYSCRKKTNKSSRILNVIIYSDWTSANNLPVHVARMSRDQGSVRGHRKTRERETSEVCRQSGTHQSRILTIVLQETRPSSTGRWWSWGGVLLQWDWHPSSDNCVWFFIISSS